MLIKKMPARMENLPELISFINICAKEKGFDAGSLSRIQLAAEEALVNVIMHAYAGSEGEVEICCLRSDPLSLTFEIRDNGPFFDPLTLPQPDLKAGVADRRVGGMGVFLVRKMTDQVLYRRENDVNVLILTFFNR